MKGSSEGDSWFPILPARMRSRRDDFVPPGHSLKSYKILIVEDEAEHQTALRQMIEDEGATAYVAGTARAAFRWIDRKPFDAMIVDQSLPDMTGVDLIDWFIDRDLTLPVVSVSGTGKASHGHRMQAVGVYRCLDKPINKTEVARAIQEAILSGSRIHRRGSLDTYQITRLRQVLDEILLGVRDLPPGFQNQIQDGRRLLAERNPSPKKLAGLVDFLGHPVTHRTLEEVGVSMAVRLLEGLYR